MHGLKPSLHLPDPHPLQQLLFKLRDDTCRLTDLARQKGVVESPTTMVTFHRSEVENPLSSCVSNLLYYFTMQCEFEIRV